MTLLTTLAFNALILAVIYLVLNRKIEKNITPEAFLEKVRSEIQSVIVELNETTDRNITLLEERVRSLQAVLKRADKQLTVLQRESEKHKESSEVYTHLRQAGKIVSGTVQEREEEIPLEQRVINLYNQGVAPASIASRLNRTIGEVELIISLHERKEWA